MDVKRKVNKVVDHFFRHESAKLIAVLTGVFGNENMGIAEDLVQDAIIEAISTWTYKGIPDKPEAWLYAVAKNKALNIIKRKKLHHKFVNSQSDKEVSTELDLDDMFLPNRILDDQLRMMFMCCHPSISQDSQVALILKTLCGFNIKEIASAFLTNKESINKRLVRARKKIRNGKIPFNIPQSKELQERLDVVLESIYLLFNEGYSASSGDDLIRTELCAEAVRLSELIVSSPLIENSSDTLALTALMQLNASRFNARLDENGNIMTLDKQNRKLWDQKLIADGFNNLEKATSTRYFSKYHILAAISSYHCAAKEFSDTDWKSIRILYDKLLEIDHSPIVLLNRAIVLYQEGSLNDAILELNKIEDEKVIKENHFFYSAKSQVYRALEENENAKNYLQKAIDLASLDSEKQLLRKRLLEITK